jgi:hypothetical protein
MEQEILTLHGHIVGGIYGAGDIKPLLGQVCLFYYAERTTDFGQATGKLYHLRPGN